MAGSMLQRGGRGRRGSYRPMAEINVTPMVDVMLVLLIVFMIAAPLLNVGVPVDLPKSNANALNDEKPPVVVTVNANNEVYLGDEKVDESNLVARLSAITENNPEANVYVRGDQTIQYGKVMEVMGLISSAGYSKVSLVAETPQSGASH